MTDAGDLQVEEQQSSLLNLQEELKTEKAVSKIAQDMAADEVARAREEIKRAVDARDMLQKQLTAAKGSGSGGVSDQSTLSLMLQVEDLKSKVGVCVGGGGGVTRVTCVRAACEGRGSGCCCRHFKKRRGAPEDVGLNAWVTRDA